jgi:hypothetical protein
MWIATPSSQGTSTLYSLPVSRRFANLVGIAERPTARLIIEEKYRVAKVHQLFPMRAMEMSS